MTINTNKTMVNIISEKEWKKSVWAGGESNELYIFPEEGDYKSRNFKARISVATSNKAEKSYFTQLPNIDRFISKLDGDLHITHEGRYQVSLEQHDIDHFSGDWTSYSTGKFKDFNLMIQKGKGDLKFKSLSGEEKIKFPKEISFCFIYIISGFIEINQGSYKSNELLILNQTSVQLLGTEAKLFYGFFQE